MTLIKKNIWSDEDYNSTGIDYAIELNGEIVGELNIIVPNEDYSDNVYIEHININEEHQNKGIGSEAIKELARQYWRVYIAPTNEDNKRLYARLGEEAFGIIKDEEMEVDQGFGVFVLE